MRAFQDSLYHQQSPNKNISIDNYDTDSDEDDHIREEEEIKRIINQAKARTVKKDEKSREEDPNEVVFTPKPKVPVFSKSKNSNSAKLKSSKGFFFGTSAEYEPSEKIITSEGLAKIIDPKSKSNQKKNQKSRAVLDTDLEMAPYDFFQANQASTKQSVKGNKNKLPEIRDVSKNQEFHKESFQHLLNLYGRSTSNLPIKLFTEKTLTPLMKGVSAGEPTSPNRRDRSQSKKTTSRRSSIVSSDNRRDTRARKSVAFAEEEKSSLERQQEKPEKQEKQDEVRVDLAIPPEKQEALKHIVPDLIDAVMLDAYEPLDKKAPNEVPRINALDWPAILKKANTKRLDMLIMNPVNFSIEDRIDINAEDGQEIKDKIHEALKEITPDINEAKLIIMYGYDANTNERKLLFTKYFFFLKNHRHYANDFKNEKEVIAYHLLVLGLLVFRITYENNPFKDNKIEDAKKKAYSIIKKQEEFPAFLCNWLIEKIKPNIAMEKVYINLNVGGKADSNFSFSIHEHLVYNFPRFARALHGPKLLNVDSTSSLPASVPNSTKSRGLVKEFNGLQLTKEVSDFGKGSDRSMINSKKMELNPCVVDFNTESRDDTTIKSGNYKSENPNNASNSYINSMPNTPSTKIPIRFGKDAMGSGLVPQKTWNKQAVEETTNWQLYGQTYLGLSAQFKEKSQAKMSLSMQRMNTTYNELIKQRYGKKRLW